MRRFLPYIILMIMVCGMGYPSKSKIADLFKDEYKKPVAEDVTPGGRHWFRGLKLYRVHCEEELADIRENHPQYTFTAYSNWLVTPSGKKFREEQIDLALKEVGYYPKDRSDALYAAIKIMEMKEGAEILDAELIKDKTAIIYIGYLEDITDDELSETRMRKIWNSLIRAGYINKKGIIQPKFESEISKFKLDVRLAKQEKQNLFELLTLELSGAIPPKVINKLHPPKVEKKKDFYEVDLFGYLRASGGWPQEWVIRYKIHVGRGIYKIIEKEELWTVKSRYKW